MPLEFRFKAAFQKAFDQLSDDDELLVSKSLELLQDYFRTGRAPHGLSVKRLYSGSSYQVYEARASARLRLVWLQTKEAVVFCLVRNHEDVRRFIKNL